MAEASCVSEYIQINSSRKKKRKKEHPKKDCQERVQIACSVSPMQIIAQQSTSLRPSKVF